MIQRIGAWSTMLAIWVLGAGLASAEEKKGRYVFVYLGGFDTAETGGVLADPSGGGALGAGWGQRFHRFLTFELDASICSTDYERPEPAPRNHLDDSNLTLSTTGVLGNLKFGGRVGRVRPYVGAGLGMGLIDVSLSYYGFWYQEPLESQFSLLTQVLAGIDIRVGRRSDLGIEYRRLFAHRTIDFDGEEVDGGGDGFVLSYRFRL